MSTTNTKRRHVLRDVLEALPLSAFDIKGADDPALLMPALFGPETTVEPIIHCASLGAWVSGWTVVTTLPDGAGAHAFVLREYDDAYRIETEWSNLSRGARINVLSHAVNQSATWTAADRSALAGVMVDVIGQYADDGDDINMDRPGALNDEEAPWVLRHLIRSLPVDAGEALPFLLAMGHQSSALGRAHALVAGVENVITNWGRHGEVEEIVRAAVHRFNGVTLNGAQIERLGVGGALLAYPFESWSTVADRVVRFAYEWDSLPEGFHPAPPPAPKPPTPPRSPGSKRLSFAIAA